MRLLVVGIATTALFSSVLSAQFVLTPGPADRQKVDPDAAKRGQAVYTQQCVNCHGALAKGSEAGPDLIRSSVALRDRLGSELEPALKRLPQHNGSLPQNQVVDLSHFLKQQIENTVRGSRRPVAPPNVLTGDAKAGKEYFEGAGGCTNCHSVTKDFAHLGTKYEMAIDLQQSFLFPRPKPLKVTITPLIGPSVTGEVVKIDDFDISIRDGAGQYRAWSRQPDLKVEITDPLHRHHELLDVITDREIHNVVRYLESFK